MKILKKKTKFTHYPIPFTSHIQSFTRTKIWTKLSLYIIRLHLPLGYPHSCTHPPLRCILKLNVSSQNLILNYTYDSIHLLDTFKQHEDKFTKLNFEDYLPLRNIHTHEWKLIKLPFKHIKWIKAHKIELSILSYDYTYILDAFRQTEEI